MYYLLVFYFLKQQQLNRNYNNKFQVKLEQMDSIYTPEHFSLKVNLFPQSSAGSVLIQNYCFDYSQIINQLTLANYTLNLEIQTLKKALQNTTQELKISIKRSLETLKLKEGVAECERVKIQKIFKKDKYCPIQGCKKRYSSRIAVNAHIRKHHLGLPPMPRKKE